MIEKLKNVLLWIIILPGSFLAGIIILFPVHWILYSTLSHFIEPYPEMPERILGPMATSFIMVKTASHLAPSHKKIVAIIMATILIFIIGFGLALGYFEI